jgi:hypothetical protein
MMATQSGVEHAVQIKCGVMPNVSMITSETDAGTQLRVLFAVDTGLRLLKPGVSPENQNPEVGDVVADINATFLVRYLVRGDAHPSAELVEAFGDNVVHHMWPYWREFLQATSARLRLPPIVLPVRVVRPKPVGESNSEKTKS